MVFISLEYAPLHVRRRKVKTAKPKGYWMDNQNVKNFFIQFAQEAGFDPLSLTRWQRVSRWQIRAKKVIYPMSLFYHDLLLTVLTLFLRGRVYLRTTKEVWQRRCNRSFRTCEMKGRVCKKVGQREEKKSSIIKHSPPLPLWHLLKAHKVNQTNVCNLQFKLMWQCNIGL